MVIKSRQKKRSQDWVEINVFPVISEALSLKIFWWSMPLDPPT